MIPNLFIDINFNIMFGIVGFLHFEFQGFRRIPGWKFNAVQCKAMESDLINRNTNISSIPMVRYFELSLCGIYINKWISVLLTSWKHDASEALQRWLTLDVAVKTCQSLERFSTAALHELMFKYRTTALLFTGGFPFPQCDRQVNVPCADWVYVIRCIRIAIT